MGSDAGNLAADISPDKGSQTKAHSAESHAAAAKLMLEVQPSALSMSGQKPESLHMSPSEEQRIIKNLEAKVEKLAKIPKPGRNNPALNSLDLPHGGHGITWPESVQPKPGSPEIGLDSKFKLPFGLGESCHGSVTVSVPYMSSRMGAGDTDPTGLGSEVSDKVSYGVIDVTIPLTTDMYDARATNQVSGWLNDAGKCPEITLSKPKEIENEDKFREQLKSDFDNSTVKNLVFLEPGFHTTFEKAIADAAELKATGVQVVVNSWPSAGNVLSYPADSWNARIDMATHTGDMIDKLSNLVGAKNMSVIGFSMGGNEIDDYLTMRDKVSSQLPQALPRFKNVMIVHADTPAALTAHHLDAISRSADTVSYFGSKSDLALQASRRLHGGIVPTGLAGEGIFAKFKDTLPNVKYYDDGSFQFPVFFHRLSIPLVAAQLKYDAFGPDVHQTNASKNNRLIKLDPLPMAKSG